MAAATMVASAKRKEDDASVVAQVATATAHREQEDLIAAVAGAHKTLMRHGCMSTLPPSLGRRRRPSLVT
jgi:hypothetical protein